MITTSQIKYIKSLQQQKYRKEHNSYVVEGDKIAKEYLNATVDIEFIVAEESFLNTNNSLVSGHLNAKVIAVKPYEMEKISGFKTAGEVLLVVKNNDIEKGNISKDEWVLLLDTIQDPGNMGTIIRIADWFGIRNIICSPDCVDSYNTKVIQSAMGSHLRVSINEENLEKFITEKQLPVYATSLQGENLQSFTNCKPGIILMGNESQGISKSLLELSTELIKIEGNGMAESLNVAVATGIVCYHLIA